MSSTPESLVKSKPFAFVGIFWDIATCAPPADQSVLRVAQGLKCQFANQINGPDASSSVTEVEFKIFGDPRGTTTTTSAQDFADGMRHLQQAQVEVVNVPSSELATSLIQTLQRFVDTRCVQPREGEGWEHRSKPKVILVSSSGMLTQVLEAVKAPDNSFPPRLVCINHDASCDFSSTGKDGKSLWFTQPLELYTFEQVLKYAFNLSKPAKAAAPAATHAYPQRSSTSSAAAAAAAASAAAVASAAAAAAAVSPPPPPPQWQDIYIHNLPLQHPNPAQVRQVVHQLVDACGGRLVSIGQGLAVVRFNGGYEYARWAKRRLDGEDVLGNRIFVKIPFLDASTHADASPDLSDYCLPKDPEDDWHPTRYLRRQITSSSSSSSSLSSSSYNHRHFRSSWSSSAAGLANGGSAAARCSSDGGASTGVNTSASSGFGEMESSPMEEGAGSGSGWRQVCEDGAAGAAGTAALRGAQFSFDERSHVKTQQQLQQLQQQQHRQFPVREQFFQNLYANELKRSQEAQLLQIQQQQQQLQQLQQQQMQIQQQQPQTPSTSQQRHQQLQQSVIDTPPNSLPPTPPLMAPKKARAQEPSRSYASALSTIRRRLPFDLDPAPRNDAPDAVFGAASQEGVESFQSPRPILRRNLFNDSLDATQDSTAASQSPTAAAAADAAARSYAELTVTNLDYNISTKEWRKILFTIFKQHVQVLRVDVITAGDGSSVGSVRVPTVDDARLAISQLHRHKVGYKRIHVNLLPAGSHSRHPGVENAKLRSSVVELLSEEQGGSFKSLPLFKFIDSFEVRFHHTISVSDLFKMRDLVEIVENSNGRTVHLLPGISSASHGHQSSKGFDEDDEDSGLDSPFCRLHSIQGSVDSTADFPPLGSSTPLSTPSTATSLSSAAFTSGACDVMLPNAHVSMKELTPKVHSLLESHGGQMPLVSFVDCYNAAFESGLEIVPTAISAADSLSTSPTHSPTQSPSPLETSCVGGCSTGSGGAGEKSAGAATSKPAVPLEHLIASVPGVAISWSAKAIKKIHWSDAFRSNGLGSPSTESSLNSSLSASDASSFDGSFKGSSNSSASRTGSCTSPYIHSQLQQFSREVVDLLKNSPHCRLPFTKFIPEYHHHFGRQCRVADYGYTKLIELFEAIPHVMQVMGSGNHKVVTLTHRSQVKRFTNDVLRILKTQACKQISLDEFPSAYAKIFGRAFEISDYGMCKILDALAELPEGTIVMYQSPESEIPSSSSSPSHSDPFDSLSPPGCWLSLPKREQTPEEMARTRQFGREVVELLRHNPRCRLSFNKFIPSYHHHFGRQCRVADYGFTKLVELLEALPDVVCLREEGEDRFLQLTQKEMIAVLANQVVSLVKTVAHQRLPLSSFMPTYNRNHGHQLNLQDDFEVEDLPQLLDLISNSIKIERIASEAFVTLVDRGRVLAAAARVAVVMMEHPADVVATLDLKMRYEQAFGQKVDLIQTLREMSPFVQVVASDSDANSMVGRIGLPPNLVPSDSLCVTFGPLQIFAKTIRNFLTKQSSNARLGSNCVSLDSLEKIYLAGTKTGNIPEDLLRLGYASVTSLLQAIPHVATLKGQHSNRLVMLQPNLLAKLEAMLHSQEERSSHLLSGDAGPQILHRSPATYSSAPLRDASKITFPSAAARRAAAEAQRHSSSPYLKQHQRGGGFSAGGSPSLPLMSPETFSLSSATSRNAQALSLAANSFCKQAALPPLPPCTLYPPPAPSPVQHLTFSATPPPAERPHASATSKDHLGTPPTIPSWRQPETKMESTNAMSSSSSSSSISTLSSSSVAVDAARNNAAFSSASIKEDGAVSAYDFRRLIRRMETSSLGQSAPGNAAFAASSGATGAAQSLLQPARFSYNASPSVTQSNSPGQYPHPVARTSAHNPAAHNPANTSAHNPANTSVHTSVHSLHNTSSGSFNSSSYSSHSSPHSSNLSNSSSSHNRFTDPSAHASNHTVPHSSHQHHQSLHFEPNTSNPAFVHAGPTGGLLTPTMFVDNHFQYGASVTSCPTTSSSVGQSVSSSAFPTPQTTPTDGEGGTIAAGLRRGMAEMFSAAAAAAAAANQRQQQFPQQQLQRRPSVELPDVLASLLSQCPPNKRSGAGVGQNGAGVGQNGAGLVDHETGDSPLPRSSTPAVGAAKPFSFAQTFGQWFPNLSPSAAAVVKGSTANAAASGSDNAIFNSLLALSNNNNNEEVGADFAGKNSTSFSGADSKRFGGQ